MKSSARCFPFASIAAAILAIALFAPARLLAQSGNFAAPRRFQVDIDQMLARDKNNPPPRNGILFIGSSIFRFWAQLREQMAPLPVFNRAFGGSVTQDMLDRMDQLVFPYKPRIIVFYCGSNDVDSGDSAGAIIERTKKFMQIVSEKSPNTFVYYTAIQRAPEKRDLWNVVEAVNREMERYSKQSKNVGYIDLNPVLFDRQGKVREELFLSDELHFRPGAYVEFSRVIKPILTQAWESGVGLP